MAQPTYSPPHRVPRRFAPAQGTGKPVSTRQRVIGVMRGRLGIGPSGNTRTGSRPARGRIPSYRARVRAAANQRMQGGASGPPNPGRPAPMRQRSVPTTRRDLRRQFPNQ